MLDTSAGISYLHLVGAPGGFVIFGGAESQTSQSKFHLHVSIS